MNDKKRILIVRTDRIGDVILTLPLASILKKYFPNSEITFLVRDYTKSLTKNNLFIDKTITLIEKNNKPKFFENINQLKNKFDVCVVAYPTFWVSLILFFSSIKIRIGSGYRWYSFLFNKKIYEHRKYGEHHELEYNVNLLKPLGIFETPQKDKIDFGIQIDNSFLNKIENFLNDNKILKDKKIIIVHPGSGGSAIDLPKEKMKYLVDELSKDKNIVLIITGSKNEKELCQSMIVNENVINTAGEFNLNELIALISKAEVVIANSTGPIHIATALGKNIIGFYPKFAAASPKRWGPYTSKAVLFQPSVCDGNCNRKKCQQFNCMNSIEINEVIKSIYNILPKVNN
ncbi:glycosyltransferase family 9 protein [Stygiobacter electus]|uniref:Glycosyltransferase family 9 protein n=1 Tax=Stygiobacter electus TaxID=3032292 RepID=A0AAE3TBR7_9BACT|nr:glycosyltransferase family 9 protein [Stygiobacter electus]MDF1611130.1 glycosyltransferase family 9 protein [Stygiobacter electus]